MMTRHIAAAIAAIALCTAAYGQSTAKSYLAEMKRSDALKGAAWGVAAIKAGGDTLLDFNSEKRFVPASNVKVITTGIALRQLGAGYRFRTELAYSGRITDGVLQGNLYILGGGDPTTASKYDCAVPVDELFARWKKILEDNGIRSIEGTVIGDGRGWGGRQVCKDWCAEDMGFYYGAEPGALNFYENVQDFTVAPADSVGKSVSVTPFFPDAPWMIFQHSCTTGATGTGDQLTYSASDFAPFGAMRGKYAIDLKSRIEECVNPYPEYTCAYHFHKYLTANGMPISDAFAEISPYGRIRRDMLLYDDGEDAAAREDLYPLGKTESPALSEIVSETLKRSDNFYAEAILKAVGQDMYGHATLDSSLLAERRILSQMGLKPDKRVQLRDGSGLARTNYVSPGFFVEFLKAMYGTAEYTTYLNAFPTPGQGTLAARLAKADPALKKRVHMKSGSMNGVRCYCGYISPADGKRENTVIFSVMVNNSTSSSSSINAVLDRLITLLAQ